MNILNKNQLIKLPLISFFVLILLFISNRDVEAKYIKKLTIGKFSEPVNWDNAFKPGAIFSSILENSLTDSGIFQIVQIDSNKKSEDPTKLNNNDLAIDTRPKMTDLTSLKNGPLSQYKVYGSVMRFISDTNPLKNGHSEKEKKFHIERAFIQAKIELLNLHSGRSLAKKIITIQSNTGKKIFNFNSTDIDYKSDQFKSYSIGKALWMLNTQAQNFIYKILGGVPLEGDLIKVDHDTNSAIINLGKANGVEIRDIFTVFSVEPEFNDPVDNVDLGDMYTRKGTIKISEVQGRFSKAEIISGIAFVPGDLVIPKKLNSKKLLEPSKKLTRSKRDSHYGKKENFLQKDITWGAYRGLPSLSY